MHVKNGIQKWNKFVPNLRAYLSEQSLICAMHKKNKLWTSSHHSSRQCSLETQQSNSYLKDMQNVPPKTKLESKMSSLMRSKSCYSYAQSKNLNEQLILTFDFLDRASQVKWTKAIYTASWRPRTLRHINHFAMIGNIRLRLMSFFISM